jgi:hypothetical protein
MSDFQVQPDWWLASDGRWYPPSAQPGYPVSSMPPTVPSGYGSTPTGYGSVPPGYGSYPPQGWSSGPYGPAPAYPTMLLQVRPTVSPVLAGWLQGLFWATGALAALAALLGFYALPKFNEFWDAPADSRAEARAHDAWIDADGAFGAAQGFMMLAWIAVFVLLLVWMHKAHRATQTLAPGPRQWSQGWTIGGWFIPLAQLVLPKLVLNEIERIATAARSGGFVTPNWRAQSTSALGWLWWISYAVGIVLNFTGSGTMPTEEFGYSPDDVRTGYTLQSIGLIVAAVSCVLGGLFVRQLSRRLSPTGIV